MSENNSEKGFIALISAIVIAAILMLIVASTGLVSIYSRTNILDSELKERSFSAADSCADEGLLQLGLDPTYSGGTFTLNSLDRCRIGKVQAVGSNFQFEVQATSSNSAVTNLQIVASQGDLTVVSWQEIPNY